VALEISFGGNLEADLKFWACIHIAIVEKLQTSENCNFLLPTFLSHDTAANIARQYQEISLRAFIFQFVHRSTFRFFFHPQNT